MGKEDLIKAQQLWYMLKSDLEHYNDVVMTLVGRNKTLTSSLILSKLKSMCSTVSMPMLPEYV